MTRDAVLTAWLEGARIGTLARIVNEDPVGVEDALRHELRNIQQEYEPSMLAAGVFALLALAGWLRVAALSAG